MVVTKNSKSHRLVESLIQDEQLYNKSNKVEKSKNRNGKKNKKNVGRPKEAKKNLTVETEQTEQNTNEYHEFISATPDYLSTQTYQQQDLYNGMNNASPIQTDYYSIYNQLAGNTLLSNVLNYNGYMNPYYSPVSNFSPVYSTYSDIEHNSYPMYSPNLYSYPLSAPINYGGYPMSYPIEQDEPVKVKKSKKKGVKKQALKDYRNREQQLIAQFHKNINENKANKIVGKKKYNKDQKENKKNRKIASKNLKILTNSSQKVKPLFDRNQLIQNNNETKPVFKTSNVIPTNTKPDKKTSRNQREPELQSMQPGMIKNAPSGYSFDALPKRNVDIEFLLNNELILSFLNNVYNGFNWSSKLTNSKTNQNIGFLTKDNNNNTSEVISWKDSQTPGRKYSIASLISMTNNPIGNNSIATERRMSRKDLYEYWSNMARKSSITENKNDDDKNSTKQTDSFINRMIQSIADNKKNEKLRKLNKIISKNSRNNAVSDKEYNNSISSVTNHPLDRLNYLNMNMSIDPKNNNQHPIAAKFNEYYNHQQSMTIPKHNHGKQTEGRKKNKSKNKDNDSKPVESTESQAEKLLNSEDPNELYEYLLNLNIESSKKATPKNFTSADMLRPTSQPNSANYESIATFTSPTLYSIPAPVPHEVNPEYNFNSSNTSPYRYSFSLYTPQTMNYGLNVPYLTSGNTLETIYNEDLIQSAQSSSEKKGKKGKKDKKGNKDQQTGYENSYINNNSLLTVLPQCLSNNSLISLTSTASSSIQEMDFSNVRDHYDFISMPKAISKKSKSKKSKKGKQSKDSNNQIGKSTLSQVHDFNNSENESGENNIEPAYSLIDIMFNSENNLNQTINNKKLSNESGASVKKNKEGSNTSLVGYMFSDDNNNFKKSKYEHSNTSLVGYMFNSNNSLNHL